MLANTCGGEVIDMIDPITVSIMLIIRSGFNNGLSLRMALNTIVLRKIMRCSPAAKAKATTGQMMNLVAVDTWNMWEWIWDPNNIFLPFFLITGEIYIVVDDHMVTIVR